jgi:hypothetical protein
MLQAITIGELHFDSYGVGLATVILAFAVVFWYAGDTLWFAVLWACLGFAVLIAANTNAEN